MRHYAARCFRGTFTANVCIPGERKNGVRFFIAGERPRGRKQEIFFWAIKVKILERLMRKISFCNSFKWLYYVCLGELARLDSKECTPTFRQPGIIRDYEAIKCLLRTSLPLFMCPPSPCWQIPAVCR